MEQISTNINQPITPNVSFKSNEPPKTQPKVSLETPPDTFEYSSGKGVLLVAGAAGAAGAGFGVEPLAKKIVNKKIDKQVESAQKLVKKLLTEDVSEEEFLSAYKRLSSMKGEVLTIVSDKLPGIAKELAPGNSGEQIANSLKTFFETAKKSGAKELTDDEIKAMGKNLLASRNKVYDSIAKGVAKNDLSVLSNQADELLNIAEVKDGSKISETVRGIVDSVKSQRERFAKYLGFKDVAEIESKEPEVLGKTLRTKFGETVSNAGTKITEALKPLKESLVEHFVKIPGKYKAVAALVGGLSTAGLVALVKPTPKPTIKHHGA